MPIISVFFGIVVRMYYKEHEPGHYHAEHQGQQGSVGCNPLIGDRWVRSGEKGNRTVQGHG